MREQQAQITVADRTGYLRKREVGETALRPQVDQLERLITSAPGSADPGIHVLGLSRATNSRPARAGRTLLQLQRRFGNRYVQRVLALSRQGEGEAEVGPEIESASESSRGRGHALDSGVRMQMESAFGADFSGVRVHTDAEPQSLNQAVNAVAFTTGSDIFFREGIYNPVSSGRELLAHELTHVVQQGRAPAAPGAAQRFPIQRMCRACDEQSKRRFRGKLIVGQANDEYEQEADQVARTVVGALDAVSAPVTRSPHPSLCTSLQRQCACGGHAASGGECEECRQQRLSRQDENVAIEGVPDVAPLDSTGPAWGLAGLLQRQGDGPGNGDGTPKLPPPLGQSITCSVDVIKIAKALSGDKSAALDLLNCCESGFKPLPAGCTKDLINALRKILGKKPGEPTTKCPPGFHAAKSSTYQGQCCTDGSTIESAQNCCPGERANMMGYCCPEGQVAQGLGCVAAPSAPAAPTPTMPEAPASEPGDYELPQESNVAVA